MHLNCKFAVNHGNPLLLGSGIEDFKTLEGGAVPPVFDADALRAGKRLVSVRADAQGGAFACQRLEVKVQNVFIVFVAGLPRKPKLPFADWYSTYARSFSKAVCSFPTRKSCALLPIASAIPQNGAIRFV